jgi:hypothetical protein
VEPELLEQLLYFCDSNKDGNIDYIEFANFLNWKDKMKSGFPEKTGDYFSYILSFTNNSKSL